MSNKVDISVKPKNKAVKTMAVDALSDTEFKETFSKFVNSLNEDGTKPKTTPSCITVGGSEEIGLKRLNPEDIERFLWMHPVVPRGIEIRTNRMIIKRGYKIVPYNDSEKAKRYANEMNTLVENSGGAYKFKKWADDTYAFGGGYLTLVPNTDQTEIVKLNQEHPIYFRIARKEPSKSKVVTATSTKTKSFAQEYAGDMKIDPKSRRASAFTQVAFDETLSGFKPVGNEINSDFVAHLTFDTWGDEVEGISLIQYVHLTLKYLLNIEEAGAETMYRSGFTQKKVTTEITNEKDLKKMAKNLKSINSRDAIIVPKGTDVANLVPGTTEFARYHDVFITLLAIRLGIPKPHLTLDGTSTNKATLTDQTSFILDDFMADELRIKQVIEEQIFKSALKYKYGDDVIEIPSLVFNEITEDKNVRSERMLRLSLVARNFTDSYNNLIEMKKDDEAEQLLSFLMRVFEKEES